MGQHVDGKSSLANNFGSEKYNEWYLNYKYKKLNHYSSHLVINEMEDPFKS